MPCVQPDIGIHLACSFIAVRAASDANHDNLLLLQDRCATSGAYLSPQANQGLRRFEMKKVLLSLAAASTVLAVPVSASAADYNHDNRNRVEQRYERHDNGSRHQAQTYRVFRKGDRFDSRQARNYRTVNNPRAYGLDNAPRGQHWVRSGNDALLVGVIGGVIGAIVANAF
jgi:Ni/Co efflux regulator RcnB